MTEAQSRIVPLDPGRFDAARVIYNHYVLHTTATFQEVPLDAGAFEDLVRFPDPRFGSWALLREDGGLVGYAVLGPFKGRCAYRYTSEVSIYLAPGETGKGLGSAAADFLEARARERGFHALIAGITAENEASLRLFADKGYLPAARLREVGFKSGRWLDVVYLEKILPASG